MIRFAIVYARKVSGGALTAPPFALDRHRGQKQPERDEAQVVDEMRCVDDALREVVEVVDNRQVVRQLCRLGRNTADPRDDPQEKEHGKGDCAGHDLILRDSGLPERNRTSRCTTVIASMAA